MVKAPLPPAPEKAEGVEKIPEISYLLVSCTTHPMPIRRTAKAPDERKRLFSTEMAGNAGSTRTTLAHRHGRETAKRTRPRLSQPRSAGVSNEPNGRLSPATAGADRPPRGPRTIRSNEPDGTRSSVASQKTPNEPDAKFFGPAAPEPTGRTRRHRPSSRAKRQQTNPTGSRRPPSPGRC